MTISLNVGMAGKSQKGAFVYDGQGQSLSFKVSTSATLSDFYRCAGMPVKITGDGVIDKAGDADDVYGVVLYNPVKNTYGLGDSIEIATKGIVYLEASASITRLAYVKLVATNNKVATSTSGKTVVGQALEAASGDGSIIRVDLDKKQTVQTA